MSDGANTPRPDPTLAAVTSTAADHAFWRFSLALYREPRIAALCLRAQDEGGADVSVLLFAIWLATERMAFDGEFVAAAIEKTRPWADDVVRPLRQVRRRLKGMVLSQAVAVEPYRQRLQAIEIQAERLEQDALFDLAGQFHATDTRPVAALLAHNVTQLCAVWSVGEPLRTDLVETFRDALANAKP